MKRIFLLAILAAVLMVAAVTAGADAAVIHNRSLKGAAGFLEAEHPYDAYWGGAASNKQLTDIGLTACAFHKRGMSDEQVLQAMMGGPEMALPPGSEAHRLGIQRVRNAVRYLCP